MRRRITKGDFADKYWDNYDNPKKHGGGTK